MGKKKTQDKKEGGKNLKNCLIENSERTGGRSG
jgi:hypothetical protein